MNNNLNCNGGCPAIGSKRAKVCLPVSVVPYAITSPAIVKCCGKAQVSTKCPCSCRGDNDSCEFVISQVIAIDIPVEFGASVKIGDTFIECNIKGEFDEHEYADEFEGEFEGEVDEEVDEEVYEEAEQDTDTSESEEVKESTTRDDEFDTQEA